MTDAAEATVDAEAILAAESGAVTEPDGPQMMSWDNRARRFVTARAAVMATRAAAADR